MAGHFLRSGRIGCVVVGADRIAANGDVANKIGTYSVAVLAKENGIPFASRTELIAHPKVQTLYEGIIEGINGNLARFEKLKRVLLVADEFTSENGAMNPTMKLRRRVIEERYRRQIDELYTQAEASVTQA